MEYQLIALSELRERGIRYSKAQIWRKVKDGSFPKPVRLGANRVAFIQAEIQQWIKDRIAERDAKAA